MRILIVEDHTDTARILSRLFTGVAGVEVTCVATATEARRVFQAGAFDLLLCDLSLPDGDGCDLMRELKAQCPGLDGVAFSGLAYPEDRARAEEAGFRAHLPKPATIDRLLDTVLQKRSQAVSG